MCVGWDERILRRRKEIIRRGDTRRGSKYTRAAMHHWPSSEGPWGFVPCESWPSTIVNDAFSLTRMHRYVAVFFFYYRIVELTRSRVTNAKRVRHLEFFSRNISQKKILNTKPLFVCGGLGKKKSMLPVARNETFSRTGVDTTSTRNTHTRITKATSKQSQKVWNTKVWTGYFRFPRFFGFYHTRINL